MTINDAVAMRTLNLMRQRNITQYRLEQDSGILHGAMDRILQSKNKTVICTMLLFPISSRITLFIFFEGIFGIGISTANIIVNE